jgi:hypothetical protein
MTIVRTSYEFSTARSLPIFSPSLLARADEVIE